ncbi:MAG: chemotaxis protein CheB, partial [Rariglobus sp.]
GALDAVETPALGKSGGMLMIKIEMLSKQITGTSSAAPFVGTQTGGTASNAPVASADWLVGIGASAGGPAALAEVLSGLPANFPAAVVIVQHIDSAFAPGLIQWLAGQCKLPVVPATDGIPLLKGHVYVVSGDRHGVVDSSGRLIQTDEPRGCIYLPSIDVFFQSMALNWKKPGTGVLLTGMGRDGAQGLLAVRKAGFPTLAQDKATSAVYGMPKAAAELGAATNVLPLKSVSIQLRQMADDPMRSFAADI